MNSFKILVPIDFSETSFSAFQYATFLSKFFNAEITLLHILTGSFNTNEPISFSPLQSIALKAESRLRYFANEYPKEENIDIPKTDLNYDARFGIPGFAVADYAHDNNYDLIIMGTRNKHGFIDRILGSTSSIVLKMSKTPTLLIHQVTTYKPIEKIAFAFDSKSELDNSLKKFDELNGHIKGQTDFVHVEVKSEDLTEVKKDIIEVLFENHQANYSFNIRTISDVNIREAISNYVKDENIDLLVLIHRDEGIFEGLFKKSISINLAQKLLLPVLIIPE